MSNLMWHSCDVILVQLPSETPDTSLVEGCFINDCQMLLSTDTVVVFVILMSRNRNDLMKFAAWVTSCPCILEVSL